MASTFEEIAKLLPQERSERFLSLLAKFKNVPDDDEYLQILEVIGFMTLIWKEVPAEIKAILEGANPVTETCHSVAKQLQEAVVVAIPSYEDLKQISKRLEAHELALKRTLSDKSVVSRKGTPFFTPLTAFIIGALASFFGRDFLSSLFL
ncbi:hypothetical protein N9891_00060 [bacterium]|nr:hypothetical protein [bacterium]